jgi:DinB family protein
MSEGARIAARLRAAIDEGAALFEGVSEDRTARRPASGAWCAREVIGHLIDSACNNQRRFIINQQAERLSVDPYEQEQWVSLSHYAETPASLLVPTWRAYNSHVARVIEHMPDEVLHRPRGPIGSYRFPYVTYQTSESATLRDLVEDYVGHIHHHFKQLRSLLFS